MRNRRFLLLAATLVALNTALWFVPQGLALRQTVNAALFGKNMVRVDVVDNAGCPSNCVEWRLDRGVVVSNTGTVLTLQEADTKTVPIAVASSTTRVTTPGGAGLKLKAVKPGWHVLVQYPGPSGTAVSVLVEKRHS